MRYSWVYHDSAVDWDELSTLYRIAPLGEKSPDALATVFGNSLFKCFAYHDVELVAAGRALADGLDCAYIADVAVHPDHQGARARPVRHPPARRARAGPQEDHPVRQSRHGGFLREARIPPHEPRQGDLARPAVGHPVRGAEREPLAGRPRAPATVSARRRAAER